MPTEFDPSDEVELVVSLGTIQQLKEANKILKLFEEDEVVREIMSIIDMLYESSIDYLESVTGKTSITDEDYDEDEEEEDMAIGIESEDEYE
jgi:hypothetical protein